MDTLRKTKGILNKYGITANKRFGQNFLIDDNVLEKIIDISDIGEDELIIEIGPGLGNLTQYLLEKSRYVVVVEIDKNMIEILNDRFSSRTNFCLLNEDILKVDLDMQVASIESRLNIKFKNVKVVANLPYYITTPIIFKLLQDTKRINQVIVMVQKEVAMRIVATPKSKEYGILSIMVQYLSNASIEIIVPNSSFIPMPNVTSAVIKLTKAKKYNVENEENFFELIQKAFSQRRKKMINSLASGKYMNLEKGEIEQIVKDIGFSENVRAEELSIDEFITFHNRANNIANIQ